MSAFSDCVGETVSSFIPDDLSWWLVSVLIACLVTALIGGVVTGGTALPVIIAGCAAVIGISIVGPALLGLAAGLLSCLGKLLP